MFQVDSRDIRILAILQEEGRISKAELARRVNLSNTPCWERVRRLEKGGIISRVGAEIALEKLTEHVVVFVLAELEHHKAADFEAFEAAVSGEPEITECWAIGGGYDYLLRVFARNIASYQAFMERFLDRDVGLARYFTYVVTKNVKLSAGPPLDVLLSD